MFSSRSLRRLAAGVSFAALLLLGAGSAWPAGATASTKAKAKAFFAEGEKYYLLAEYDRAAEAYRKAYELLPDSVFLFNIAQSYRLGGNRELALRFYKNYLLASPKAPNRSDVERLVAELETAIAASVKAKEAPPLATIPASPGTTTAIEATDPVEAPPDRPVGTAAPAATDGAAPSRGSLVEPPGTTPAVAVTPPAPRSTSLLRHPLPWLAAAAVIVGGGTALAYFLLREP